MRRGIDILHEDADIVVVSKPAGMLVHKAPGRDEPVMVDELRKAYPEMRSVGGRDHEGVVHRLDLETSGVMVFARSKRAYSSLRRDFERHDRVEKTYLAVTNGSPPAKSGTVDNFLFKSGSRMRVSDESRGLRAVTHWEVLGKRNGRSLVEFRIETGRMHQIRVHAAALGCPVAGDALYGDRQADARRRPPRMLLHAVQISFPHPATGRVVEFAAPPPPEMLNF